MAGQKLKWDFELKIETAFLIAYAATFVLMLGWATRRSYLTYFGIDQSGLDEAYDETTINYLGYGLRALFYAEFYSKFVIYCSICIDVYAIYCLIWLLVFFTASKHLPKLQRSAVKFWVRAAILVCLTLGGFHLAQAAGDQIGKEIANDQLSNPFEYYRIVSFSLVEQGVSADRNGNGSGRKEWVQTSSHNGPHRSLYSQESDQGLRPERAENRDRDRYKPGDGCWLKLLMDKKSLYLFFQPPSAWPSQRKELGAARSSEYPEPSITVIRLDLIGELEILPSPKLKACPK
jgi:hypothetical protein